MIDRSDLKKIIIKTGTKKRVLYTYKSESQLKNRHTMYLKFMMENFYPSIFTHAYVRKRSIYTNAIVHIKNDYFVKIDVKDFFPSLSHNILANSMYEELNRNNESAISLRQCADIVADCSVNKVGIPLGLITSPMLSNIYMKKFDGIFYGKLKKVGLKDVLYTRYADDIFVSFKVESGNDQAEDVFNEIIRICGIELNKIGLRINKQKTKTIDLNKSNHVKIAGVNLIKREDGTKRLTVSRSTVKELYFNAMRASQNIQQGMIEAESVEVNRIKGLHSFILSIQKTGYSHILSAKMKDKIKARGYQSLEELISDLGNSNHIK